MKKTAKASAATFSDLTLRHIAERLSELHEVPKRQANEMMGQVIEMIAKSLKKGDKILPVRPRHPAGAQARCTHGPQPQTGEPVKIKASKKIAFRAAKDLKESI